MKHLFIYILCAFMCCGAYAQSTMTSPPPAGVKMKALKAAEARITGRPGLLQKLQKQQMAAKSVRSDDGKLYAGLRRMGRPMRVAAVKAPAAAPVADDMARITVNVESDWGDGSGYQMLLDADCTILDLQYVDEIFAESEYMLPENAGMFENWLVAGQTASVDIPAGKYDYVVFNPTPSDNTYYIANGESSGDAYEFKGGCEYVFTITVGMSGDNVAITSNSPVSIGVSGITAPVSGEGLTAAEAVTATIFNNGTEAVSSFTATLTVDGGTPVAETVSQEIAPGATLDYTFTATADLSAPGMHTVTVAVDHEDDALAGDNTFTAKVNHVAPIPAPYTCSFDEEADVDEWTTVDGNMDGDTWNIQFTEGYAQIIYNAYMALDDYLVTVNPIALKAGTNKVVIDYNAQSDGYYESFEVLYGKTSNVEDMTVLRTVDDFAMSENGYVLPVNFDIEEDGAYFFAIHATSEADQMGILINSVEISEGAYKGTPDLVIDKVQMPLSSCSLGDGEKVVVVVSNNGTADAKGFTLAYTVNGGQETSRECADVAVPAGGSVEVELAGFDFSGEGKYTVAVEITDVTPADGQNEETVTDNNSAEGTVTHYTPTDVPFTVVFSDPDQRDEWASDESWVYDGDYNFGMYCVGTTPLVSRGVNLEAGKRYRISYNYMAGMYYFFFVVYDSYDIVVGKDGAPLSDWETVASFTDVYTNDAFADNDVTFTVPADGVYSIGFKQDVPQGVFTLASVSVTEVTSYDVTLSSVTGLPSMLPKAQAEGMEIAVPVKNNGAESVSGTVSVTFNGTAVGSAAFTGLAPDATETVSVPVVAQGLEAGSVSVEVEAVIDGQEDSNPADNSVTAGLEITDKVYAYDYVTDDMYNEMYAIGVQDGGAATAGIPFLINAETTLEGVSVGWGVADGQQIGLCVYKWDPTAIYQDGVIEVGDEVYTTTADQGTSTEQVDYLFDEPVTLEPGYYFIGVTYAGYALAVDNVAPGQLYLLDTDYEVPLAIDQSGANLGTPAIRAILDSGELSGIGNVDVSAGTSSLVYDEATKTVTAVSPSGSETSLAVYAASGAMTGGVSSDSGSCVFDASSLAPGVYVAKMTSGDYAETSKFVVK